ncbi:MFS transporter [Rhodoglobus sp. NPDC076762]
MPRSGRRWWALSLLALAQFLVVLDASIVNIALPVVGVELQMSTAALAWVITAYVLAFGGLLLLGGRLADRWGHRRVFLAGVIIFVLASAAAGFAASSGMLLAARAVQGAGAALLAPAALALLTHLFPKPGDRARALGVWGGVAGIGSAVGVLLGGVLTSSWGWQWVFFVNVPVGALVLATIPFLISRDERTASGALDLSGAVTVTGALVATVGTFSAMEQLGVLHPVTLMLAGLAVALTAVFIVVERRAVEPLVPLAIFANRSVAVGNAAMLLLGAAMVALFFALSVFMQAVLGFDALTAGLTQLPLAGALVVIAGVAPVAVNRWGLRGTLSVSFVVLAGGLSWLSFAPADAGFVSHLLGPTLVIGVGLGAAFVTATQLAVADVDGSEAGLAGGLVNTSQQIGGALGLAVLASLAAMRTDALLEAGASTPAALTGGFSWLFLGAGALALLGALVVGVASSGVRSKS